MNHAKKVALEFLRRFEARQSLFDSMNKTLKAAQPKTDFPQTITMIDSEIEAALIVMLDAVLGDAWASYYLYDRPSKGGEVVYQGRAFPITSVDDLEAYLEWEETNEKA